MEATQGDGSVKSWKRKRCWTDNVSKIKIVRGDLSNDMHLPVSVYIHLKNTVRRDTMNASAAILTGRKTQM
jgi:hypothetical protein